MNTYNSLIPSALKWAAVVWFAQIMLIWRCANGISSVKETHSGLYLTLDLIDVNFILVFCGQGSSFMVNDISGVFYAKINDV
jgi:hypothetical protein